jgi:hypothetical protein
MSEADYSSAVLELKACYTALRLSISDATVVVNSKALFHLFPDFIPPIDRQYTVRFFTQLPERWLDPKKKFRLVSLPTPAESQFGLFRETCVRIKRLADQVKREFFEKEQGLYEVTPPKALDNAIVNYVRIVAARQGNPAANLPA